MKSNHVPRDERIRSRIVKLELRIEASRRPGRRGNPYWSCRSCGIHDPELSIQGQHRKGCPVQGLQKQVEYFKTLLTGVPKANP